MRPIISLLSQEQDALHNSTLPQWKEGKKTFPYIQVDIILLFILLTYNILVAAPLICYSDFLTFYFRILFLSVCQMLLSSLDVVVSVELS